MEVCGRFPILMITCSLRGRSCHPGGVLGDPGLLSGRGILAEASVDRANGRGLLVDVNQAIMATSRVLW